MQGENRMRLIVLLGLAGMILILLSGLLPDRKKEEADALPASQSDAFAAPEAYRRQLEERLTALLSRMEGVGSVTVMITVDGTPEQIFAEEVKAAKAPNSTQQESAPVLARSGSEESALVAETRYPDVCGAAILCTGGGSAAVRERIIHAAAALLDIPVSQIYVGPAASAAYTS